MIHRRDMKYLIAYLAPLTAWAGFHWGGWWSPGMFYLAFGIIPLLEAVLPVRTDNPLPSEEAGRRKQIFFDVLLWCHVPLVYALLILFLDRVTSGELLWGEQLGMLLNMGLVVGVCGINVGHELGHRSGKMEQFLAWALLLPALYLHFQVEHNRGHHRWVGTDRDPASALAGEWLYPFWWRSISGGWAHAWALERDRLRESGRAPWHPGNRMIGFHIAQLLYLAGILAFWGWTGVLFAAGAALIGILLLETINYIEHYGLRRRELAPGRFEPVQPRHSWNSDHELGRIFLFELTRHSDHHYRASRPYPILRHLDDSPQLPFGYPGSMILSMIPPLWIRTMARPLTEAANRITSSVESHE